MIGGLPSLETITRVAAVELQAFYYAFCCWRAKPEVTPGSRAFSIHREAGVVALFSVIAVLGCIETVGIHFLISRWNRTAAWVLTILSGYGLVWIVGLCQSIRLRPVLLDEEGLLLRLGLVWSLRVPYSAIAALHDGGWGHDAKVAPLGGPKTVIELHQPATLVYPFGITRQARRIGVAVDGHPEFVKALESQRLAE